MPVGCSGFQARPATSSAALVRAPAHDRIARLQTKGFSETIHHKKCSGYQSDEIQTSAGKRREQLRLS